MRYSKVFAALALLLSVACTKEPSAESIQISLLTSTIQTKSDDPKSEGMISDLNVYIYNSSGKLEERAYLSSKSIYIIDGVATISVKLVKGMKYSIFAMANLGYQPQITEFKDIMGFRYWMTRPDEYVYGIPMSGSVQDITIGEDQVSIPMERVMSKVNIKLDKSQLSKDVQFDITDVMVGNCPRNVAMFGSSGVTGSDDVFAVGFTKKALPTSVYLMENLAPKSTAEASYIELHAEYNSSEYYTELGKSLIYRFHISTDEQLGVERNCIYNITVIPKGDGLGGVDVSDWRIDKSELTPHYNGTPYLKQYPSDYIECHIGDVIHIGCEIYPPNTPFDIGLYYLESDKETGIYDYEIDDSGTGVYLTMKKGGQGLVYMEAAEPIDDAALFVIMCEP